MVWVCFPYEVTSYYCFNVNAVSPLLACMLVWVTHPYQGASHKVLWQPSKQWPHTPSYTPLQLIIMLPTAQLPRRCHHGHLWSLKEQLFHSVDHPAALCLVAGGLQGGKHPDHVLHLTACYPVATMFASIKWAGCTTQHHYTTWNSLAVNMYLLYMSLRATHWPSRGTTVCIGPQTFSPLLPQVEYCLIDMQLACSCPLIYSYRSCSLIHIHMRPQLLPAVIHHLPTVHGPCPCQCLVMCMHGYNHHLL